MAADAAALLLTALGEAGAPRMARAVRHAGIVVVAALLAAVLLLAALGCALAALWIVTAPRLGPAGAALVVAVCLLVLGLAALAVVLRRRPGPPTPVVIPLGELTRANKATMLTAALIAGLCVGLGGNRR